MVMILTALALAGGSVIEGGEQKKKKVFVHGLNGTSY